MPAAERDPILARLADILGLPLDVVVRGDGRVSILRFVRELLRDQRKVVGLYDATVTATDPFPDRDEIGLDTDRQYILLSQEVNVAWKNDADHHAFDPVLPGATDDLRYGLSLNPHLKAFITHGHHDLITPFHTSDRLRSLMRLDAAGAARVTVRHFPGGHMFYAHAASRAGFTDAIRSFVSNALVSRG